MRFLFITPNTIDLFAGGSIRSSLIRNALAGLGEVDTVVFRGAASELRDIEWDAQRIRNATYTTLGFSLDGLRQRRRLRKWIRNLLGQRDYDFIVVCFLSTVSLLPRAAWNRVIADADDAFKSAPPGQRVPWRRRLALHARNLLTSRVARRVRHIWYVNPADGPGLQARSKSLLRNVICLPPADRSHAAAVPGRLLMVGLMAHEPNIHGLRWFASEVLPSLRQTRPDVELHVVGRFHAELEREFSGGHVRLRGFVDDLAAEYDLASVVVAPVFHGGGTQIKVIDALAHARPLVASTFAHAGFANDLRAGQHLLVADDPQQWIAACLRLLAEPATGAALGARGREAVASYGADSLAAVVRQTISDLGPP